MAIAVNLVTKSFAGTPTNLIFVFGQAFMNLSAISCSTNPSGFSKITVDRTVKVPVNLGQNEGVIAAEAEFNEIVPLTATRVAEATAINFRLVARIVDLSLQVDFQMHSQITAQIVQ
jgi:hypothetical protein